MGKLFDPRSRNLGYRYHGLGTGATGPQNLTPNPAISTVVARNPALSGAVFLNTPVAISNSTPITPILQAGSANLSPAVAISNATAITPSLDESGGGGDAVLVQSKAIYEGTSLAFDSANTLGNTLIAFTSWNDPGESASPTISDTLANGWTALTVHRYTVGAQNSARFYYKSNCAAGANTVSLGSTGGGDYGLIITEWSGLNLTPTVLEDQTDYGVTSNPTGTITTSVKSLILAALVNENGMSTINVGTGYTMINANPSHAHGLEYKAGVAAGIITYDFNTDSHSGGMLVAVAIEEA